MAAVAREAPLREQERPSEESAVRVALRIALAAVALVACSPAGPGSADTELSQEALLERLGSQAPPLVLDVRSPEEFASGHVPGARNLPVGELASRAGALDAPRDATVVVYCERGPRARQAQAALSAAGFSTVLHLEGDMSAWREKGLPCDGC